MKTLCTLEQSMKDRISLGPNPEASLRCLALLNTQSRSKVSNIPSTTTISFWWCYTQPSFTRLVQTVWNKVTSAQIYAKEREREREGCMRL